MRGWFGRLLESVVEEERCALLDAWGHGRQMLVGTVQLTAPVAPQEMRTRVQLCRLTRAQTNSKALTHTGEAGLSLRLVIPVGPMLLVMSSRGTKTLTQWALHPHRHPNTHTVCTYKYTSCVCVCVHVCVYTCWQAGRPQPKAHPPTDLPQVFLLAEVRPIRMDALHTDTRHTIQTHTLSAAHVCMYMVCMYVFMCVCTHLPGRQILAVRACSPRASTPPGTYHNDRLHDLTMTHNAQTHTHTHTHTGCVCALFIARSRHSLAGRTYLC